MGGDPINTNLPDKKTNCEVDKLNMVDNNNTSEIRYNTLPPSLTLNNGRIIHYRLSDPVDQTLPNQVNREFRLVGNRNGNLRITENGDWELPRRFYNREFNKAFNIYKKLPADEIMRDYDIITHNLKNPHADAWVNSPQWCVLKYAGSQGILSDETVLKLKGSGNGDPVHMYDNPLARSKATRTSLRVQIQSELDRGRDRMVEILNNRNN